MGNQSKSDSRAGLKQQVGTCRSTSRTLRLGGALLFFPIGLAFSSSVVFAAEFHPIEVPQSSQIASLFAVPRAISPDGARVAGAIDYYAPFSNIDCLGPCTLPFSWSATGGTEIERHNSPVYEDVRPFSPYSIVGVTQDLALLNARSGNAYLALLESSNGRTRIEKPNEFAVSLIANALSSNSETVVGSVRTPDILRRPYRWTQESGVEILDVPGIQGAAIDVSADGNAIVVGRLLPLGRGGMYYWTPSGGTLIPLRTPYEIIWPVAISSDGSTAVGYTWETSPSENQFDVPFRWTSSDGLLSLEPLEGYPSAKASGVSGDGKIVVGTAESNEYFYQFGPLGWQRAILWNDDSQVHDLQILLEDNYGLAATLEGWTLSSATAISDNGLVIAGWGFTLWRLRIMRFSGVSFLGTIGDFPKISCAYCHLRTKLLVDGFFGGRMPLQVRLSRTFLSESQDLAFLFTEPSAIRTICLLCGETNQTRSSKPCHWRMHFACKEITP